MAVTVPPPILSGHPDGLCLRDETGTVIDVFPDYEGANIGFRMACVASVLLAEVFAEAALRSTISTGDNL